MIHITLNKVEEKLMNESLMFKSDWRRSKTLRQTSPINNADNLWRILVWKLVWSLIAIGLMVYVRRMDFGQTEAGGKSEYIFVTNLKLLVRVG